jgi:type II secretory pathway component PulF
MNTQNTSLSNSEKITFISNFSTMLSAGISILEAVDSLLEDAKGNQKKVLQTLRENLVQGKHVYVAFSKFPNIFDKVTVSIIKASEEAGTLDTTLRDLKNTIKKQMEFNDKIRSALLYPTVIVFVFFGVLIMILIVVIPKISTVFSQLKVNLPLPTKILIFLSNLILQHTILVVAVIVLTFLTAVFLFKTRRRAVLKILFSLPLISDLVKKIDLTRFTYSLHLLLNSGIPIISALELTQDVVIRSDISQIIEHAKEMVITGKRLSDGLRTKKGTVPTMMIKIIEAGERSGSLDLALQDISEYLDYEVTNRLQTLTVLLEPIMLVIVGVVIGTMMLSIIGPIYQLIGNVGRR